MPLAAVFLLILPLLGPAAALPSTSSASSADAWVVEDSPSYSGPRGQNLPGGTGEHFVSCVPAAALALDRTQRTQWRQMLIPAEHAYDETYVTGVPSPQGTIRLFSGTDQ